MISIIEELNELFELNPVLNISALRLPLEALTNVGRIFFKCQ
jgi:hypothetical protein